MGQTVNLLAYAFGGSNPSLPTVERVPIGVANSGLRPERQALMRCIFAEVAQLIEH